LSVEFQLDAKRKGNYGEYLLQETKSVEVGLRLEGSSNESARVDFDKNSKGTVSGVIVMKSGNDGTGSSGSVSGYGPLPKHSF
jgi:hypothetical protein